MKIWMLVLPVLAFFVSTTPAMTLDDSGRQVATTYGIDNWDQLDSISFTFNVQTPGGEARDPRGWTWNIADRSVVREVNGERVEISLDADPESQDEQWKQVHKQFINDSYWFLFPFQLVWSDPQVTAEAGQEIKLPIGDGTAAKKLICQWPSEGGYTPGDAYDLYLGEDGLVEQWVFRRGGKPEGGAHTWEDHQQLGPIVVCLDHRNAEDTFRLWFTDVQATLKDGSTVKPEQMGE